MGKGLQKITFSFREKGLTYFAGIPLIHQFCKSLQLKRFTQQTISLSHRPTTFHWSDLLLAHFYCTLAGLERWDHLPLLKYNGLLPVLIGLDRFPSPKTMRDFLHKLSPQDQGQLQKLHNRLRAAMLGYPSALTTLTLDFDSTVLTVYGRQQGAEVGYNPKNRGRRSYRPLLAFETHRALNLHGQLRPGNFSDQTDLLPFLQETFRRVPSTIARSRIRLRLDAGFYGRPVIEFLDDLPYGYVVVAQTGTPIKERLPTLSYRLFNTKEQFAITEFHHQFPGWKRPHRYVVLRKPLPEEPDSPQKTLLTIDRFQYHVFITNLDLAPEHVVFFYQRHALVESMIKELRNAFFITKIPTRVFSANQAHFQLLLLDSNLFRWFQICCLPASFQSKTLSWVRKNLLAIPGKLILSGRQHSLRFPRGFAQQPLFEKVYHNARKTPSLLKAIDL
jgi:hypothetical protein